MNIGADGTLGQILGFLFLEIWEKQFVEHPIYLSNLIGICWVPCYDHTRTTHFVLMPTYETDRIITPILQTKKPNLN